MTGGWNVYGGLGGSATFGALTATSLGTGIAASSSTNTKGTYVQLTAATTADIGGILIQTDNTGDTSTGTLIDIATGASGSEQIVIADTGHCASASQYVSTCYFPVRIASGSRIAARSQGTVASAAIKLMLVCFADTWGNSGSCSVVDTYGATSASSTGTAVTAGAANTKGSWAQITASTTADIVGFLVRFMPHTGAANGTSFADIGTGAAGSEIVLIPNYSFLEVNADSVKPYDCIYYPIPIAASTRLAVRFQSATASLATNVLIYGVRQ